jgi:hypothetical protein
MANDFLKFVEDLLITLYQAGVVIIILIIIIIISTLKADVFRRRSLNIYTHPHTVPRQ